MKYLEIQSKNDGDYGSYDLIPIKNIISVEMYRKDEMVLVDKNGLEAKTPEELRSGNFQETRKERWVVVVKHGLDKNGWIVTQYMCSREKALDEYLRIKTIVEAE